MEKEKTFEELARDVVRRQVNEAMLTGTDIETATKSVHAKKKNEPAPSANDTSSKENIVQVKNTTEAEICQEEMDKILTDTENVFKALHPEKGFKENNVFVDIVIASAELYHDLQTLIDHKKEDKSKCQ